MTRHVSPFDRVLTSQRIIVEVLDETREIAGIIARVVRDRVFLNDVLIEDTLDWFAQADDAMSGT